MDLQSFDQFSHIQITVTVSDGFWGSDKKVYLFNKNSLPTIELLDCSNKFCNRGGFSLNKILDQMSFKNSGDLTKSERCCGDHGSPKGRRKGKNCSYVFEYHVNWKKFPV